MGYGDYFPSGGNHRKKPLTKKQLQKMKEAYAKADVISEHVKELEEKESEKNQDTIDEKIESVFL